MEFLLIGVMMMHTQTNLISTSIMQLFLRRLSGVVINYVRVTERTLCQKVRIGAIAQLELLES